MYNAYVTKLKNVRQHPNADKILLADCFGNTVCVGLDAKDGDMGIYFPTDGQLSVEYAEKNNLIRKKDENGNNIGGYLDPDKRNITAIRLRGEKSDGLFMPLSSLDYTGTNIQDFTEGNIIHTVNGHEICCKYIPKRKGHNSVASNKLGNKTRKKKLPIAPLFIEHADTEQLAYNLNDFKSGDLVEITLKCHGTSQRTGYLPVLKGYRRSLLDKILRREGKPVYDWGYVSGTRRVVLEDFDGGYYGSNEFRERHSKFFEGKLQKGEEVYYEVVGYTHTGAPIMGSVDNKKLQDKDFIKTYGKTTEFSYGCSPNTDSGLPQSRMLVYRMTMTNEDGYIVEYTPDYMRYRCEQMGVECVPVLWKGFIPSESSDGLVKSDDFLVREDGSFEEWLLKTPGNYIKDIAEQYYDGADPIGKTHIREGVVVRIVNRPKFTAYKLKNFSFKVLEGIAKVNAETPDMEEIQEIFAENMSKEFVGSE